MTVREGKRAEGEREREGFARALCSAMLEATNTDRRPLVAPWDNLTEQAKAEWQAVAVDAFEIADASPSPSPYPELVQAAEGVKRWSARLSADVIAVPVEHFDRLCAALEGEKR